MATALTWSALRRASGSGRPRASAPWLARGRGRRCSRTAERGLREAAGRGAQVVCLPELFRSEYFCQSEDAAQFAAVFRDVRIKPLRKGSH